MKAEGIVGTEALKSPDLSGHVCTLSGISEIWPLLYCPADQDRM